MVRHLYHVPDLFCSHYFFNTFTAAAAMEWSP